MFWLNVYYKVLIIGKYMFVSKSIYLNDLMNESSEWSDE